MANKINIAIFKFCYIDINETTDVRQLFEYYQATMSDLKGEFPFIKFIHTTVPLRTSPGGLGVKLRELLGRPNLSKILNRKRNEFNEMLISAYPNEAVFDIAGIESTYPDGNRRYFLINGKKYYCLIEDYTDDGGHLNAKGRNWLALQFLRVLSENVNIGVK